MILGAGLSAAGLYLAARDAYSPSQRSVRFASIPFAIGVAVLGFVASKPIGAYFSLLGLSAVSGVAILAVWMSTVTNNVRAAIMFGGAGAIAAGCLMSAAQEWLSGTLLILVGCGALGKGLRTVDVVSPTSVLEPFWICIAWCCWVVSITVVITRTEVSLAPAVAKVASLSDAIDAIGAVDSTVWLLLVAAVALAAFCRARDLASP